MLPAHKALWPYGPPRSGHTSSCAGLSSAFQLLPLTAPQPASGSHVDQGLLALSSSRGAHLGGQGFSPVGSLFRSATPLGGGRWRVRLGGGTLLEPHSACHL